MTKPDLTNLLEVLRSPQARPLIREVAWTAGGCLGLILFVALVLPGIALAIYLAVGVFFAAILTGLFVSLVESETEERLLDSPVLRRWVAGFAAVLALLAAVILV